MAKFNISAAYYAGTSGIVDLPFDSWDDVYDHYVKWDTLHYCLKSDTKTWHEAELNSDTIDIIDWKRPTSVEVYKVIEDDNYAECVYEN